MGSITFAQGPHRMSGRPGPILGGGLATHGEVTKLVEDIVRATKVREVEVIIEVGGVVIKVGSVDDSASLCLHRATKGISQEWPSARPGSAPRIKGDYCMAISHRLEAARCVGRIEFAGDPSNRKGDVGTN